MDDTNRLKKLAGLPVVESWEEVKVDTDTGKTSKASEKKAKENNKDVKNKTADDVSTEKEKVEEVKVTSKSEDVKVDTDTKKEGKASEKKVKENNKDVKNKSAEDVATDEDPVAAVMDTETKDGSDKEQKVKAELEDQAHTISYDENGAAKVDDETEVKKVKNESVESEDDVLEEGAQGIAADINKRIQGGKKVQISVTYNGDNFTGFIKKATNNVIHAEPTANARKRFNMTDKLAVVPVDLRQLKWSDKHPDRVIGVARKLTNQQEAPKQKSAPEVRPTGDVKDSSTWAVDMQSYEPKGKALSEDASVRNALMLLKPYRNEFILDILEGTASQDVPDQVIEAAQHLVELEINGPIDDDDFDDYLVETYAHVKVQHWFIKFSAHESAKPKGKPLSEYVRAIKRGQ